MFMFAVILFPILSCCEIGRKVMQRSAMARKLNHFLQIICLFKNILATDFSAEKSFRERTIKNYRTKNFDGAKLMELICKFIG